MAKHEPDFYLRSTEYDALAEPRKCWRLKRLRGDFRDDFLLIQVDPPIIGQPLGLGGDDVDKVIVAPRHIGVSLFPIVDWPVFVHVALPLTQYIEDWDLIGDQESRVIYWAELYPTWEEAASPSWLHGHEHESV
jgi:hypothetical protein